MTLLLAALALGGQAAGEIQDVYRRFTACWDRGDVEGLSKIMHPTGVTITLDGSRWQFSNLRRDLPPMFAQRRNSRMAIVLDRIDVHGEEAGVWLRARQSFESLKGGRWEKVSGRGAYYETLRRSREGWRIVESVELFGG